MDKAVKDALASLQRVNQLEETRKTIGKILRLEDKRLTDLIGHLSEAQFHEYLEQVKNNKEEDK